MLCACSGNDENRSVNQVLKLVPYSKELKKVKPSTFQKPAQEVFKKLHLSPYLTNTQIASAEEAKQFLAKHAYYQDSLFVLSGAILTTNIMTSRALRHRLVVSRTFGVTGLGGWMFRIMDSEKFQMLQDSARITRHHLQRENAEFHRRLMSNNREMHSTMKQNQLTLIRMPKKAGKTRPALRQDTQGGVRLPKAVFEDNEAGCWLLNQMGWTVEDEFFRMVNGCVGDLGNHVRGQVKSVPWMMNDCSNSSARAPVVLANADVLRAGVIADTPQHLVDIYDSLVAKFGRDFLVDIENSFNYSEADTASVDGFRCIMLTFRISFDAKLGAFIARAKKACNDTYRPSDRQHYLIDKAMSSLTPIHAGQNIVMLGQVQIMLRHHFLRRELADWISRILSSANAAEYADKLCSLTPA